MKSKIIEAFTEDIFAFVIKKDGSFFTELPFSIFFSLNAVITD